MNAVIYIEGGGDRNESLKTLFRRSWAKFFAAAGLKGRMPRVVHGGSRNRTFDLFERAIANPGSGQLPFLLVDSEEPLQQGHSALQHLRTRDNWLLPDELGNGRAFLMVQIMETWFLADRVALRKHFGERFRDHAIGQWPQLEEVPKTTVLTTLRNATDSCSTPYTKGKVSFELLQKIDPGLVEAACPHAKALLQRLRMLE